MRDITHRLGSNRIISLKELDPGFCPRWYRLRIWLMWMAAGVFLAVLAGELLEQSWVVALANAGFFVLLALYVLLHWGSGLLAVLGYWVSPLAMKAAQLDKWLERDLEWNKWQ